MIDEADVVVIGGGLHGCSAALQLALRGRKTILLERRHIARHSSGINAGGVRTLGRDLPEVALSVRGMALWRKIDALVGDSCGFTPCGQIKVAETDAEFAQLEQRVRAMEGQGFSHERLMDREELRRRVPALARHCVGGLVVDDDGAADPFRTTLAFARRAREVGVSVLEGQAVLGIDMLGGRWRVATSEGNFHAPVVVNAAGAWAAQVASLWGESIPLSTRASMMIVTERLPRFVDPVIGATGRPLSFKQTECGTVLIGGGQQGRAVLEQEESFVHVGRLSRSARTAVELFPLMRTVRMVRSWCGIEAQTPDHLPVIGPSSTVAGVVHAFGFSGHGFQLGPICGVAVADLVTKGSTDLPIQGLGVSRFDSGLSLH
jgi:sarcosine oxidase subunit beta